MNADLLRGIPSFVVDYFYTQSLLSYRIPNSAEGETDPSAPGSTMAVIADLGKRFDALCRNNTLAKIVEVQ